MSNSFRTVSIIIPTYNRANFLGKTLESCINQTYPEESFEIIVADNNSTDNTKEVVEKWQKESRIPIKYVLEKRQGAHFARHTASKNSIGEILYFTDDDMIADKNLLKNIVKVFDMNQNVAVAGGKVLPEWETDPPDWLIKYFKNGTLSLIENKEELIIASYDMGIYSCHQAILKEVLFKCGGFNPDIIKDKLMGNGETGLNIKVLKAEYKLAYVNDAVTHHMIPPSRMTQKYINKRFGHQGICDSFTAFRKKVYSKKALIRVIFFSHIPSMLKRFSNSVYKKIINDDLWRLNRAYSNYYLHRIKSDIKLAHDNEWRKFVLKNDYMND